MGPDRERDDERGDRESPAEQGVPDTTDDAERLRRAEEWAHATYANAFKRLAQ